MSIYAVIPARSGSKGLKNKNIKKISGHPLIKYSIDFAKKLKQNYSVFCSTDSEKYRNIAESLGAEVPFLRSAESSGDTSMEQDILKDMREKFIRYHIEEPDFIVWLRPTFVFRSLQDVQECIDKVVADESITAARTVCESESRLYKIERNFLIPNFNDSGKSMVRRQDVDSVYKVFSTDVFRFKGNEFGDNFLGSNIYAKLTNKLCGLDIDDQFDFDVIESIISSGVINIEKFSD